MDIGYLWEKLHGSVFSLISGSSYKDRLESAYMNLAFIPAEQVPAEIRDDFNEVMQLVRTAKPDGTEGRIKAAVRSMDDEQRYMMAKKILYMYDKITRMDRR